MCILFAQLIPAAYVWRQEAEEIQNLIRSRKNFIRTLGLELLAMVRKKNMIWTKSNQTLF